MENSLLKPYRFLSPYTWGLFFCYLILLFYFSKIDVYHQYFFSNGPIVLSYHLVRIFYMLSLAWLCYATGYFVLRLIIKDEQHAEITLDNTIVIFFIGLSVWQIVLLPMGFAGLYQRNLMVLITAVVFISSLPRLNQCIHSLVSNQKAINKGGLLILFLPILLFLMAKGLYPSGGHDYYTHYFSYYRDIVESGSILQGRNWYHFYYDKGLGLYFLSMLLTDPLAPQLVTTMMTFASAGIVFSLVRQSTNWRLLPWIAVAFYFSFLIYTPGPGYSMRETGWNELEKTHESATVVLFFIIWATIRLAQNKEFRFWGAALIFGSMALAIMSAATSMFAVAYLVASFIGFIIYKKLSAAKYVAISLVSLGILISLLLLSNYFLTGLPDEQQALLFWKVINFDKVNEWGGLFQIINLHNGRISQAASKLPINNDFLFMIKT